MTLLCGSLTVSKTIYPNHPDFLPSNDWFGSLIENQSISLNGGKVKSYFVTHKPDSLSKEVIDRRISQMGNLCYWKDQDHDGVNEYAVYLSMSTHECANRAYEGGQYELAPGVLLSISTKFIRDITSFKEVKPWTPTVKD
ncbi:hypothetical protein [Vibrio sp. 10N.239.312.D08]|uniref:hypothetical protein n=1 Tax=Vibrio sp. 10N.239.312.D08 TaxID=3229978 RepID=UPI00354E8184